MSMGQTVGLPTEVSSTWHDLVSALVSPSPPQEGGVETATHQTVIQIPTASIVTCVGVDLSDLEHLRGRTVKGR